MKKEKSCGCIVFDEEKNVLLVRMVHGHYSFPKGHVERNETEFETALREVKEETNIECDIISGFRHISTYSPFPNVVKDVVFFVAKSTSSDIVKQEEEVSECGFYSIETILKLVTFKNDLDIFIAAVDFYNGLS